MRLQLPGPPRGKMAAILFLGGLILYETISERFPLARWQAVPRWAFPALVALGVIGALVPRVPRVAVQAVALLLALGCLSQMVPAMGREGMPVLAWPLACAVYLAAAWMARPTAPGPSRG